MKRMLLPLMVLLAACEAEQWDDCITSSGPERVEERAVGAFQRVVLEDRVDLVLEDRAAGTVAVAAGGNLMDQIVTEAEGGMLTVRNENRCNWVRSFKPRITVHVPLQAVVELELRGTGDVHAADTVRHQVFRIEQRNAQGTVELPLAVDTCYVGLHTGAGDVRLAGRCGVAYLYSGFMGPIDAGELAAQEVNVNNSGVADIICRAQQRLNAQLFDVGDVRYYGDPVVQATVSGSGQVVRLGP
ncbi:MAG TPA: DUF2807 domain-containing protein [Flavobacteriales bacterium]|nr:DUF2807 domain-containing protein [Flavobacteriales bacterium]HMR29030.1 DUF2807 domain-containing protein [Flavobacteriales bacterium]